MSFFPSYFTAATIPTDYTFTLDHAAVTAAATGSGVSTPTFVTPILNGPPAAVFYNGMDEHSALWETALAVNGH